MAKAKRGYSREFARRSDRRIKLEIDWVPPTLAKRLRAGLAREGVSLRALTLRLWKRWADELSAEVGGRAVGNVSAGGTRPRRATGTRLRPKE